MNKAPYTPHNHGNPPFALLLVVSYYPSVGHQSLIETLGIIAIVLASHTSIVTFWS